MKNNFSYGIELREILKYNTELCNDFSNLIHRTIGMIKKYGLENEKLHIDNEKIDKELLNEVLR